MRARGIRLFLALVLILSSGKAVLAEQIPVSYFSSPLAHLRLTSGFGDRMHPIRKVIRHHDGVDLAAPNGTLIYAVFGGRVAYADTFGGYGKLVVLIHPNGVTSHYAHCRSLDVEVGDVVKRGDLVGKVGHSGAVTGPHLHFEIRVDGRPIDPTTFLSEYYQFRESHLLQRRS